jgi:hypothetical protein
MKARIIAQKVSMGVMDYVHGGGSLTKRLVVEEKDNLCITIGEGQLYAFTGFNLDGNEYELVGETEVPDELVEQAFAYTQAKMEFDKLRVQFEKLLE